MSHRTSLPAVGTPAPNFTLPSTSGADVTLSSLRGKTLREFKAKERLTVELLSDFKPEVSRRYGALMEEKVFSNRAYVLLGQVLETHQRTV